MKYLLIFLLSMSCFADCVAQAAQHAPNPKAKLLEDSAIHIFTKAAGDTSVNNKVIRLLEMAVKIDNNYYEGWVNLMTFQCRINLFEDGLKTVKKMEHIFPDQSDVLFNCGILEYATRRDKDAMATFTKLLKIFNAVPSINTKSQNYKAMLISKGVTLILLDKPTEGKNLLKKLYQEETDGYVKSYIAFYVNSSKEQIIADKIPGK